MAFADLVARVSEQPLRAIAQHWNEARGARLMPGWSDLKPAAIAPYLKLVWIWNYDAEKDHLFGRLIGETASKLFGGNNKGLTPESYFGAEHGSAIAQLFRTVIRTPSLVVAEGNALGMSRVLVPTQCIALPLASDGVNGDGLLGATTVKASAAPQDLMALKFNLSSREPQLIAL